jgi:SSS family solute:Na+ symporter
MTGGTMLFMMVVVGHLIGRLIIATVIVPYYFKGDVYTTYQLLSRAFGPKARYVASGLSLVGATLGAGVRVYVTAIPLMFALRTYFPWWDLNASIVTIMVFSMVYTAFGGIKAVIWTDMLQYFIFVGGGLFALFYIPSLLTGAHAAPSGATGWSAVHEVASEQMKWFSTGILSGAQLSEALGPNYTFGQALMAQMKNIFGGEFNLIMGLIAVPPGIVLALGFDQMNVQRILCCRSGKEGSASMLMSAVLIAPQFLMFLLVGICLYAYYTLSGLDFGGFSPTLPSAPDKPRADFIFPIFIMTEMPPVTKGFMLAAILAAAMSSVASALSAMSSMVMMDFYKPLMKDRPEDEAREMKLSRVITVVSGFLLALVAYVSQASSRVFDLAFTLAGLTAGGILGAFVVGLVRRRGQPAPVITGMLVSFVFMIILNVLMIYKVVKINWPWHAPIGMIVCLLVAWPLAMAEKPATERDISRVED